MDFIELARERFSCKSYDGRKVPEDKLGLILEAARLAPTAKNLQNYLIYIAESEEALNKVDEVTPCRYGASTVLILTYDESKVFTYPGGKYDSGFEDTAIVASHIILAAQSVGVDSCWINNIDPDEVKKVFNLSDDEVVVCLIDLGFRAEGAGPLANHNKRRSVDEIGRYI
ncbi:nitroreductase family protein [Anaerococcus lactolyticus]|uniref:Nitroreductase n=1 Tax=Anaerococcus lactolyticus S7-1-13 TaxID=1284686 RepID=A0A095Y9Y7_9FIRM|nr:nitroreductase family protein [Anaerococcus lactolyticus]KGF03402.1 nitroreductase [Anaerococcus lactolyticus S7-1-13]